VKGRVTVKGQPIKRGLVVFLPQGGGKDPFSAAIIDGVYETAAMPTGVARIYVTSLDPVAGAVEIDQGDVNPAARGSRRARSGPAVPAKYQSPDTSRLEYSVQAGSNVYDIELK
jgi:hypothetical protein